MRRVPLCLILLGLTLPAQLSGQEGGGLSSLKWEEGPMTGDLSSTASVNVPERCMFLPAKEVPKFMTLTENTPDGDELGIVFCFTGDKEDPDNWFVIFSFDESGYVRDDDKDELDADAILASIRRGTEAGNKERRENGWSTLTVDGWVTKPFYDQETNNLTWALVATDDGDDSKTVNHSVRLLGRSGVMNVELVAGPDEHARALPVFSGLVSGFAFKSGHRYAEWRSGDKVASYGLTALVAGGAGALAVKSGLFAKFWKLIVAGLAVAAAGLKGLWARIRGPSSDMSASSR